MCKLEFLCTGWNKIDEQEWVTEFYKDRESCLLLVSCIDPTIVISNIQLTDSEWDYYGEAIFGETEYLDPKEYCEMGEITLKYVGKPYLPEVQVNAFNLDELMIYRPSSIMTEKELEDCGEI